jgi:O-succinylbenzoic acid--CoA ligase
VRGALSLPAALRHHAARTPDAPAVAEPARTWSFAALDAHADVLAAGLAASGLRPGDRVALLAAPSATAIALLAAAGRIGACVAPLGTRLTLPELRAAAQEIAPRMVVHDADLAAPAQELGIPAVGLEALAARGAGFSIPAGATDEGAPAVAVLTSGTTGRPKAALLSHGALAASAAAWAAALPPATGWFLCLGLAHVAGLGVAWRSITAGVPLHLVPAFDAEVVLALLRDGPASHVSLVPTQLARLLDAEDAAVGTFATRDGEGASAGTRREGAHGALRAVLLGGATIPPALVMRALAAGWPVVPTYGLTEAASGVTALATLDAAARPWSAGRPLPGVEVRIVTGPEDGPGDIEVRTPAAFSDYIGRPKATTTAEAPDGWLRTGDTGRLDADGYLEVLDRRDDLFVSGGENVAPAEVEAALERHPAVAEAGVVGRPDPTWGTVAAAALVLRPDASRPTDAELRAFCLAQLAPYKVPAVFRVVASLPRGESGKLQRRELRPCFAEMPATPAPRVPA